MLHGGKAPARRFGALVYGLCLEDCEGGFSQERDCNLRFCPLHCASGHPDDRMKRDLVDPWAVVFVRLAAGVPATHSDSKRDRLCRVPPGLERLGQLQHQLRRRPRSPGAARGGQGPAEVTQKSELITFFLRRLLFKAFDRSRQTTEASRARDPPKLPEAAGERARAQGENSCGSASLLLFHWVGEAVSKRTARCTVSGRPPAYGVETLAVH